MPTNVWILSKGRPDPVTSKVLDSHGVNHTIFVEPQDEAAYRASLRPTANLHVLEKNDQGIAYVRQAMLTEGRRIEQPFWMLDDDIHKMFKLLDREPDAKAMKRTNDGATLVLDEMERDFLAAGVCYGTPSNDAFAVFGSTAMNFRTLNYVFIWMDPRRLPADLNYDLPGREDVYFAAKMILMGGKGAQHGGYSFVVTPLASNKSGGLTELYSDWDTRVLPVCQEMADSLDVKTSEILSKLPPKVSKAWGGKKVYAWYEIGYGPSKGKRYIKLSWVNLSKLSKLMAEHNVSY
jgi:hypothetical protein